MSRNPQNAAMLETSFLHGVNAAYIEEMQALYEKNPGSVSDEWRLFFQSLNDGNRAGAGNGSGEAHGHGASWARPLDEIGPEGNQDLLGALTGDYGGAERHLREKIAQTAQVAGVDMSMAASLRSTQDSIRALMLIRAYRVMGHLVADLDPLGLFDRKVHKELRP